MNTALLALEQTPPLSVPLRFFLTAPLFGVLAGLLLVYNGPAIFLYGRWTPEMLALTHLLTLGVLGMVIMGAMLQLLPILAVSPVPKPVLVSSVLHIFHSLGSLSLAVGFIGGHTLLLRAALILLGLGFFGFAGVVSYCLLRAKAHSPTVTAMRLTLALLAITVVLGLGLGMGFAGGAALPMPLLLTNVHLTWGLAGWAGLLIIGVAYQIVPMFQITPQYPSAITRRLILGLFLALLLWTVFYSLTNLHQVYSVLARIFAGLAGLGFSVFAVATLYLQMHRLRRLPDLTLNYWRLGMLGLLFSIGLWLSGVLWPDLAANPAYDILLGASFIAGFILPVMQGMLYKIVPFLTWLHLHNLQRTVLTANPQAGMAITVPNMKQVIPNKRIKFQFWCYLAALALLAGAILWPPGFTHAAGALLTFSFLLLGHNLYTALNLYSSVRRKMNEL